MKAGAIGVDDAELGDPFAHLRIVREPAEEDKVIARDRPRRFEIPMPGGDGLALRLAKHGDVNLAILVVGGAIGLSGGEAYAAEGTERAEEQDGVVELWSHGWRME